MISDWRRPVWQLRLAGCKKAGQHRSCRAIEDTGIVEACREVGEDVKERNGATGQAEPPESDDGVRIHGVLSAVRLTAWQSPAKRANRTW